MSEHSEYLLWGFMVGFAATALFYARTWIAHKILAPASLRPNCLMTRYPIVMMTRPQSLWTSLRAIRAYEMIRQHGYCVQWLRVTEGADCSERLLEVLKGFEARGLSYHLLATSPQFEVAQDLSKRRPWSGMKSLNLLDLANADSILDTAIVLAEDDFAQSRLFDSAKSS